MSFRPSRHLRHAPYKAFGQGGVGGGGSGGVKSSGIALRWNARGFGFIKPDGDETGENLFCHYSSIDDGNCLREGDKVWFVKQYDDRKGKYRAEQVTGGCTEERQAAPAAGACYDFQAGRCSRGDGCRFSHDGGGGGYGGGGGKGGGGYGGGGYGEGGGGYGGGGGKGYGGGGGY
jgi:cold shock CspA family protein